LSNLFVYPQIIFSTKLNETDSNGFWGESVILRRGKFFDWSPKSLNLAVNYLFICNFLTHKSKDLGLYTMNVYRPKIYDSAAPQNLLERETKETFKIKNINFDGLVKSQFYKNRY